MYPGQRNWIVLGVFGALALIYAAGEPLFLRASWATASGPAIFAGCMFVGALVILRKSRRHDRDIITAAAEDRARDTAGG